MNAYALNSIKRQNKTIVFTSHFSILFIIAIILRYARASKYIHTLSIDSQQMKF